ncbi:MAG: cell cycle protein [Acidobacteria bacterium]|nr:cell cycle protein [Acidobacteriota bacterium]
MFALSIFVFLVFSVISIVIDLKYRNQRWRRLCFLILMMFSLLVVIYHYRHLAPFVTTGKLEIQGQYFPLKTSILISGDPATADYYAPSLLLRGEDDSTQDNPTIRIAGYDDRRSTLEVTAKGTARPLRHNDQIVNIRPLESGNELTIGGVTLKFENGLFLRSRFVIGPAAYPFSWPDSGSALTIGELLCRYGLDRKAQQKLSMSAQPIAPGGADPGNSAHAENPLDHVWLVRKDWWTLGLVNGSTESVKVDGVELVPEIKFTIKSGDKLVYGTGRRTTGFTIELDPSSNRIYVRPEHRLSYPLYQPVAGSNTDAEVFISSAPTSANPAYQLPFGERNRELIKGSLKYKFEGGIVKQFALNSGMELRSFGASETAALGSSDGGIVLSLTDERMSQWRPLISIGVVWAVVTLVFFFFGGIANRNYLFALVPTVQMMLAIRLVLSYRAYVLPPAYEESYEKALFALIFIPFAIFVWLHVRELSEPFDMTGYVADQRKIFGRAGMNIAKTIFTAPPLMYMLISFALLWMVGVASAARFALMLGFFVVSVIIAFLFSTVQSWNRGKEPLVDWLAKEGRVDIIVLFAVPLGLPVLLRLGGFGTEVIPFTGLRAELIYLPCLFLGSCRLFMWFFHEHFGVAGKPPKPLSHLWLALPNLMYFAEAVVVGDWGFLIYSVPIFFLAVVVSWRAHPGVSAGVTAFSAVVLFLFFGTSLFTQNLGAVLPQGSTVEYRYLAYQNTGWLQEAVLEAKDDDREAGLLQKARQALSFGGSRPACAVNASAARRLMAVNEHFWTMFHFAARGSTGVGYGEAPIERVPFADGIAQSDNTYSIYVLAEHGSWGGIALLSLYLYLTLLLLFILSQHFGNELEPTLIVGGIALTILFGAFYHASGNVNGLPFTGKNLPLLSLNSTADILLIGFLLAMAFSVLGNGRQDLPDNGQNPLLAFAGGGNMLNKWLLLIAGVFSLLFFPAVCYWSVRASNDNLHRGDYDLGAFVAKAKQYITDGLIELDKKTEQLSLKTAQAKGLAEKQYLRLLRDQFNAGTAEEKRSGKYFFVLSEQVLDEDVFGGEGPDDRYRETVLTVDQNYFRRPSPFLARVRWHGDLLSGTDGQMRGYLAGEGINLFLPHVIDSDKPIPGINDEKAAVITPGRAVFPGEFLTSRRFKVCAGKCDEVGNQPAKHLFDIYSIEADTVLEPHSEFTYVNGQEVRDKTRLEPGDIIAIKGSPQTLNRTLVFAFRNESPGLLAKSHWLNGREEYTFPQGEVFALARPIIDAINSHVSQQSITNLREDAKKSAEQSLRLPLEPELNRQIYNLLVREAEGYKDKSGESQGLWQEVNKRRGLTPRLAVTAMNPQTGEVLALASWPAFDPNPQPADQEKSNPRSYTSLLASRSPESRRYLLNHNLTRHVIGSATKPFIASAAACAFPQVLTLVVDDNAGQYNQVLGIPTTPDWLGGARGITGWNRFFSESNNLFAVTTGFLGLSNSSDSRLRFLNHTVPLRYQIDGQFRTLQPDFTDVFDSKTGEALKIENSLLASRLNGLFDIQVSGPDAEPMIEVWQDAQKKSLLPVQSSGLSFISPESTNLALNNVRTARGFVGVCLGGNTNLWSNVKTAEAFSRLVTGRRVQATMVRPESTPQFDKLDNAFDVVRPALLDALEGVARPGGTAAALFPAISAINSGSLTQNGERFAVFAKTGTLEGQYKSGRNDSNIIFAAGMYNPVTRVLRQGVVVSIFIEKGNKKGDSGRATLLAARLMSVLNEHFGWNRNAFR